MPHHDYRGRGKIDVKIIGTLVSWNRAAILVRNEALILLYDHRLHFHYFLDTVGYVSTSSSIKLVINSHI